MENLIELRDIVLYAQEHPVLDRVNVAFPKGQNTVIMGPSGCGKSSLLKIAAGIILPDSGEVRLEGRSFLRLSERRMQRFRRSGGFMFQDAALWANKSLFENLALPLQFHLHQLSPSEVQTKVNAMLERMDLQDSAQLRPSQLSFGEQKIASFLRALILEPSILFLDEPTTSIDSRQLERMMGMIKELKEKGCTILAVTHDAHLTSMIANALVVMKQGRILEAADLALVRRSRNREVIDILTQVLSEAATYDTDLLDLLQG